MALLELAVGGMDQGPKVEGGLRWSTNQRYESIPAD
jgi:hypothetical protein